MYKAVISYYIIRFSYLVVYVFFLYPHLALSLLHVGE
jgi:hypothetical protein